MVFNRFTTGLLIRVGLLLMVLIAFSFAVVMAGYYAVTLLTGLFTVLLIWNLHRYVSKTNSDLVRFLDAVRFDDFNQSFSNTEHGANFDELAVVYGGIMADIKESRQQQEEKLRHLNALTEHIPVPLMSVFSDERIQLHNNAARRLFAGTSVSQLDHLQPFGENLVQAIRDIEPGRRRLVNVLFDGVPRQLTMVASQVVTETANEKLISMQDIQSELDDVQLQSWQDLVRVLRHEIMNSITPVASLARTATDLVGDVRDKADDSNTASLTQQELDTIYRAVDTVARRSDGLMQFVQGYSSLTPVTTAHKLELSVQTLFERIQALLAENWQDKGIELITQVYPQDLELMADPDLVEQLLLNLLRNAEQALVGTDQPQITLEARINQRGCVQIDVSDNGPGISAGMSNQVFVPFYTTKEDGSGIGLALARQIMIAHGGSINAGTSAFGGASFTLIF